MLKALVLVGLALLILAIPATAASEGDIAKRLEKNVSVSFEETDFREVIAMFSAFSKVDMTVDPALENLPPVTLTLEEISTRDALELAVRLVDPKLAWDIRWGGIFIATKDRLKLLPKEVPGEAPGLDKALNVDFAETALMDVVRFLGSYSGTAIVIDPDAKARVGEVQVSLECNNATLHDVLSRIIFPANLAWIVKDEEVHIVPAMIKRTESKEEAARRLLGEKKITLDFEQTPLRDVVKFFAQNAGINICIDPMLEKQRSADELMVALKTAEITLKNALELITLTKNLSYDFRWGGVFIASPDRLKVLPRATLPAATEDEPAWAGKLRKQLEGPISFSFDQATLPQALDFLRTLKSINIVFEPEARKAAEGAMVTLTVNGITIADALALMLVPHGFTFELKNEVVLVSLAK